MSGSTGSHDDVLLGGEGNDILVGGTGQDLMIGGFAKDGQLAPGDDGILIDGIKAPRVLSINRLLAESSSDSGE